MLRLPAAAAMLLPPCVPLQGARAGNGCWPRPRGHAWWPLMHAGMSRICLQEKLHSASE